MIINNTNWLKISSEENKLQGVVFINHKNEILVYNNLNHFKKVILFDLKSNLSPYYDFIVSKFNQLNKFNSISHPSPPPPPPHCSSNNNNNKKEEEEDEDKEEEEEDNKTIYEIINKFNCRVIISKYSGIENENLNKKCQMAKQLAIHYKYLRILYLVPKFKCLKWKNELGNVEIIQYKTENIESIGGGVIMAIETLINHNQALNEINWNIIFVDDCEKLNGEKRNELVIPLLRKSKGVVLFTELKSYCLMDLFNLFSILHPHIFIDKEIFMNRYSICTTDQWGNKEIKKLILKDELKLIMSFSLLNDGTKIGDRRIIEYFEVDDNEEKMKIKEYGLLKIDRYVNSLDLTKNTILICKHLEVLKLLKLNLEKKKSVILFHGRNKNNNKNKKIRLETNEFIVLTTIDTFKFGFDFSYYQNIKLCIFVELDFSYSNLLKCENLIHDKIEIKWLIFKNTIEEFLYKKFLKSNNKLDI